jgi:hypothetical protein
VEEEPVAGLAGVSGRFGGIRLWPGRRSAPAADDHAGRQRQLDGRTAHVIGTLAGSLLRVTKLEAGSGDAVQETVAIELQGTLRIEPWTIPLCPVPRGSKEWQFFQNVEVSIDGKVYTLDLGDRDDLWQVAEKAAGGAVVVTGTLPEKYRPDVGPVLDPSHLIELGRLAPNIGQGRGKGADRPGGPPTPPAG